MSHYRIRREGIEFPVAGLEALVRLVQEGTLGSTDRVWEPASDRWVPAGQMGLLKGAFAERAREQAARRNRSRRPRPAVLASADSAPIAPRPPVARDAMFQIPPDLESHSQELADHDRKPAVIAGGNLRDTPGVSGGAMVDDEQGTDPNLGPPPLDSEPDRGAEVIEFPDENPERRRLATLPPFGSSLDPAQARAALEDPAAFLRTADTPPPNQPKPAVRPALLLMTVIVGLVGAFLIVSYVQHNANMYNARLTTPSGESERPAGPTTTEFGVGEVASSDALGEVARGTPAVSEALYEDMELELRNRMAPGCLTIAREDDLDTALRIELSRLGVQAYSVHAPVLTWGGRRGDVPNAVEIKIWYEGQPDELDRELSAIGLVVGKYAQQYGLDIRSFDVYVRGDDGKERERSLDPTSARRFYLRHLSLLQFLTGGSP